MSATYGLRPWASRVALAVAALMLTGLLWVSALFADEVLPGPSESKSEEALTGNELERGRGVFHRKCNKCHGSGREGAPIVGLPGAWARSLQKPVSVLIDHAINGHTGARGRMPPMGGFDSLTRAEVTAAVHYIVARGEWLANQYRLRQAACLQNAESKSCIRADSSDADLLRLLWILNGIREQQ